MELVCLRDVKAGIYLKPIVVTSTVEIVRSLTIAINSDQPNLPPDVAKFPGDFELYHVGIFDDRSGFVTPIAPPAFLVSIASLREVNNA